MAIVLRNTKGSALTYAELDGNFTDLNGRVLDSDGIRTLVDSDYVIARAPATYTGFDSDFGTKTTTNLSEGTNLYYTSARFDSDFGTKTTDDVSEGLNLYYTTARFNADLAVKSTDDLDEGSNLYYTTARHDSDFAASFSLQTTGDLLEGATNLYYTTARHDSDFNVSLNAATLGYTTDSATLWNGTPPTTVDSALDRIALLVRTLNGGTGA